MKKNILFALLCFIGFSVNAQTISIGTGSVTTSSSPWDAGFGYSYVQSVYLQSEINATGSISSIEFYNSGTSLANNNTLKVYMANTNRTSFSSATDWEPLSALTLVFDGTISPTLPGWVNITLSTPFPYDNTKNLLIAVDENTPASDGTRFTGTSVSSRVLHYRNNTTNPDPASPPTGAVAGTLGNIRINGLSAITPVVFSTFEAGLQNEQIVLQWQTVTEINNKGFEVQQSYDGINFSDVAFVKSKSLNGNSNQLLSYSFTVINNKKQTFYRLKQVDNDGKYAYSKIIKVHADKNEKQLIQKVYPNPANNKLYILRTLEDNTLLSLRIIDAVGKPVYNNQYKAYTPTIELTIATLPKGIYWLQVMQANAVTQTLSFVKE